MIRKAFVMSVKAGAQAEYARRHDPIWSELEAILRTHGVHNYSIFLLKRTDQLFAYAEIESERQWAAIAATPECQKWWRYMAEIMPHSEDHSPIAEETVQVFHLD
jgi:L-rhamnose mutarotase